MFPAQVSAVLTRLEQAGFPAYAVGGCVRDTLLGRTPEDWDVTTAARPEQTAALFAGHSIPTGLRHGTVTVRQDGLSVEVTTFRADGPYSDHRRPDAVYFSDSLAEDLCRRDLTVNAMAMDVRGALTDLYGGQDDLRRGVLRCVGDPDRRFGEDALRIMRTLRFSSVLGFTVEERTAAALHRCAPLLRDIAAERLLSETDRLLCGAHVLPVLLAYPDVLGVFLPELLPCVGLDQRNRHHLYDVWEHTARSVAAIPPEPVLRWAMLLHDVGKPACFTVDDQGVGHFYGHPKVSASLAEELCRRLRMDKRTAHEIVTLVQWHDRDIPRTERAIARAVHQLGEDTFRRLLAIKRADNLAQHPAYRGRLTELDRAEAILDALLAKQACFSLRDLAVDGRDMLALGLRGPAVGHTLDALLAQVLDGALPNDRAALLAAADRGVRVHALTLRGVADRGYVFERGAAETAPDAVATEFSRDYGAAPLENGRERLLYLCEQAGEPIEAEVLAEIDGAWHRLRTQLPAAIVRNRLYTLRVQGLGAAARLTVDSAEWEEGGAADVELRPGGVVDAAASEIPADMRLSAACDTLYIPHTASACRLVLRAEAGSRLLVGGSVRGVTVSSQALTRGLEPVVEVRVQTPLRMPGTVEEYISLDLLREEVALGRVVLRFAPNPLGIEGSLRFDDDGVCDYGRYVEGELARLTLPAGRTLRLEFDGGESSWMKLSPDGGAWRLLGGWRPNDPTATGRV